MSVDQAGIRRASFSLFVGLLAATSAWAGQGPGVTELYNSEGTFSVLGGPALDGDIAYFTQGTDVFSLHLGNLSVVDVGDIPANVDVSIVERAAGTTYVSYSSSFARPFPYFTGYIDAGGVFTNTWTENGVWDVAQSPAGDLYIAANPDPSDFSTNPPYIGSGATIYRYDPVTKTATQIVTAGGFTGPVAFDSNGNLYYGDQSSGNIWKFTPAQLGSGGLTGADAEVVASGVFASYIAFDGSGYLYAAAGFPSSLHRYDLATGQLIRSITPVQMPGLKGSVSKFVWHADKRGFLVNSKDWFAFAGYIYSWIPPYVGNDFDRDGFTDLAVYWPVAAKWYIRESSTATRREQVWGGSSAVPVPGDYDGDSVTDIAVYDTDNGNWFVLGSAGGAMADAWGWSEAVPVSGDYDGDGLTDLAVYHAASGTWYVRRSSDGTLWVQPWGTSEMAPVPGDYDGDGITDVAVYHAASGMWYARQSSDGSRWEALWGWSEAEPVPGDYDGDGTTDAAVYHAASGMWYARQSSDGTRWQQAWGWSEAEPVAGDYDGDGLTDAAVYHAASGMWYVRRSSDETRWQQAWGPSGAVPVKLGAK